VRFKTSQTQSNLKYNHIFEGISMKKESELLFELRDIIRRLRAPDGCPWDRKQTPKDVKNYLTEELYELLEAIDTNDIQLIIEETGDILFMLFFLVNLFEEKEEFSLVDALHSIKAKMIHRHPHVFGNTNVNSAEEVKDNWQKLKLKEGKKPKKSFLDGIQKNLPALSYANSITLRASQTGFDWKSPEEVFEKIKEEISELENEIRSNNKEKIKEEIGDVIFSLVNLSRHLEIEPEQALRKTNQKFKERFEHIEKKLTNQGRSLKSASLEEMDRIWEESKKLES
jgi:MazG family protein